MSDEYKPINNLWKDSEGYRYFGTLKLSSKIKYAGDDFIQLWEWVKQLQQENKQLKEELEYTIRIVEHNRIINEKNKEIHQLKDNWNKLKEFVLKKQAVLFNTEYTCYSNILDKMQEIEQGSESK